VGRAWRQTASQKSAEAAWAAPGTEEVTYIVDINTPLPSWVAG